MVSINHKNYAFPEECLAAACQLQESRSRRQLSSCGQLQLASCWRRYELNAAAACWLQAAACQLQESRTRRKLSSCGLRQLVSCWRRQKWNAAVDCQLQAAAGWQLQAATRGGATCFTREITMNCINAAVKQVRLQGETYGLWSSIKRNQRMDRLDGHGFLQV